MIESKYEVILYWDNDDAIFVAEVTELPGCMAYGKSKSEAVESAEEDGIEIPQPRGKLMYA